MLRRGVEGGMRSYHGYLTSEKSRLSQMTVIGKMHCGI